MYLRLRLLAYLCKFCYRSADIWLQQPGYSRVISFSRRPHFFNLSLRLKSNSILIQQEINVPVSHKIKCFFYVFMFHFFTSMIKYCVARSQQGKALFFPILFHYQRLQVPAVFKPLKFKF